MRVWDLCYEVGGKDSASLPEPWKGLAYLEKVPLQGWLSYRFQGEITMASLGKP